MMSLPLHLNPVHRPRCCSLRNPYCSYAWDIQSYSWFMRAGDAHGAAMLQVYSASLDGTVRHWDFSEGILLNIFPVNAPIKSLVSCNKVIR